MTRVQGDMAYPTSVDAVGKKPLDAKMLVKTKADLTNLDSWKVYNSATGKTVDSFYQGMIVSVSNDSNPQNNGLYRLANGSDVTNIANWEKLGAGGGGDTIKVWQPTVIGDAPIVTLDRLVDLGGGLDGVTFDATSVTAPLGSLGLAVSTALPTPLAGKYGIWTSYSDVNIEVAYYMYSGLVTQEDLDGLDEQMPSLLLAMVYYAKEAGLAYSDDDENYQFIADWNPAVDSVAVVFDADNRTLSYYTNRDNQVPILSFDLVALGITTVPEFATLGVVGGTASGVRTFDIDGVQSVFGGALGIDETDLPNNAADNFFRVAGLSAPAWLASLNKTLANKDVVAFDGEGLPSQVIQVIDMPPTPDLNPYVKRSELAEVAISGLSSDIDNSGENKKFVEPEDLDDYLTKEDWKAFPVVNSSHDALTLPKGTYTIIGSSTPSNLPSGILANGAVLEVLADPYYNGFEGKQISVLRLTTVLQNYQEEWMYNGTEWVLLSPEKNLKVIDSNYDILDLATMNYKVSSFSLPANLPSQDSKFYRALVEVFSQDNIRVTQMSNSGRGKEVWVYSSSSGWMELSSSFRENQFGRNYTLSNSNETKTIDETGALISVTGSNCILEWKVDSYAKAFDKGYFSIIDTFEELTLKIFNLASNPSSPLTTKTLPAGTKWLVKISLPYSGGSYFSKFVQIGGLVEVPSTNAFAGTPGHIAADDDYVYVCNQSGNWVRIPIDNTW